jgi:hypothetical protein
MDLNGHSRERMTVVLDPDAEVCRRFNAMIVASDE